jgi:hypothetical protein
VTGFRCEKKAPYIVDETRASDEVMVGKIDKVGWVFWFYISISPDLSRNKDNVRGVLANLALP